MNFIAATSLTILCLLFSVSSNLAFDCRSTGTPAEELKLAAAVFSGKVVAFERQKVTDITSPIFGGETLMARFKVDKWWKGSDDDEVLVGVGIAYFDGHTVIDSERFRFFQDEKYLVYANGLKQRLYTDGCSRTRHLSIAGEDLFALGEGLSKTKQPNFFQGY